VSKTETPDIVSLLRERGEWKDGGKVWEQDALCAVAAAEIERLRSELAKQGEIWRKTLHVERECSLNETRLKDQFRSRALATEAELAKHQWRTMDDAPLTGLRVTSETLLLAHASKKWIRFGKWYVQERCWYYSGTNERSQWAQVKGDAPTHWQPLPSPPGENDGD